VATWHRYGFISILMWWYHGIEQHIRDVAPFISCERETSSPPQFWLDHYSYHDWRDTLGDDLVPGWRWIYYWQYAVKYALRDWIDEVGTDARDTAVSWVHGFTGWVSFGYSTFQEWMTALRNRVGIWLPSWADDVIDGLIKLYTTFPLAIRNAWITWEDQWEGIKQSVREWVNNAYSDAKAKALSAWYWVQLVGLGIATWYDSVRDWVLGFVQDPYSTIVDLLGETWNRIVTFAQGALSYYFNLWGAYAATMSEFWADPLGWLYDRAETYLIGKWG